MIHDKVDGREFLLSLLSKREWMVLYKYYIKQEKLEDLSREYHVTRERIRQIAAKAIRKIHGHIFVGHRGGGDEA